MMMIILIIMAHLINYHHNKYVFNIAEFHSSAEKGELEMPH